MNETRGIVIASESGIAVRSLDDAKAWPRSADGTSAID
jgi:hypothetical protein